MPNPSSVLQPEASRETADNQLCRVLEETSLKLLQDPVPHGEDAELAASFQHPNVPAVPEDSDAAGRSTPPTGGQHDEGLASAPTAIVLDTRTIPSPTACHEPHLHSPSGTQREPVANHHPLTVPPLSVQAASIREITSLSSCESITPVGSPKRFLPRHNEVCRPNDPNVPSTPPPPCERNTLVRATVGVVSTSFGRAYVLRQAIMVLQPHLVMGRLVQGDDTPRCKSLIPPGGCTCMGLTRRPYFASRVLMVRQLKHLAAHCTTVWQQQLLPPCKIFWRASTLRRQQEGPHCGRTNVRPGPRAVLPQARQRRLQSRRQARRCPVELLWARRRRGPCQHCAVWGKDGVLSSGGLYPLHGAPSCRRCLEMRQGLANCCQCGHEGHPQLHGAPLGCCQHVSRPELRKAVTGCHKLTESQQPEVYTGGSNTRGRARTHINWPLRSQQPGGPARSWRGGSSLWALRGQHHMLWP